MSPSDTYCRLHPIIVRRFSNGRYNHSGRALVRRRTKAVSIDQTACPFGSKASLTAPKSNVRFTPESELKSDIVPCPKSATNGLIRRSKQHFQSLIFLPAHEHPCWVRRRWEIPEPESDPSTAILRPFLKNRKLPFRHRATDSNHSRFRWNLESGAALQRQFSTVASLSIASDRSRSDGDGAM